MEQFVGERLKPAKQRGLLSTPAHRWHRQLDQVRRSLKILGGKRVPDRIGRRTILLVPLARAPMQGRYLSGLFRHQLRIENVRKEVVVAKPMALVVQRNDKEVASLQGLQPRVAILLIGDGIAQRATQP